MFVKNLLLILITLPLIARPLVMQTKAKTALIMNGKTGKVLYEKGGYEKIYPASTTKVATALYAIAHKKTALETFFTVSPQALEQRNPQNDLSNPWKWNPDGTRMWLVPKEKVSLEALLHGLLLISGNDAANVIAENLSPSTTQFVEDFNHYLASIGCKNTQFLNPHGCHHPDHWTTAYDLCLMMKEAISHPTFCKISSTKNYLRGKTNYQKASEIKNYILFFSEKSNFYTPEIIAAKTGYHKESGYVLLAACQKKGRTLIGVVGGLEDSNSRYKELLDLFETTFEETPETAHFFNEKHLFVQEIEGSKEKLKAFLKEPLTLSYYPSEEPECKAFVAWKKKKLPIQKGEVVGEVRLFNEEGLLIKKAELFAKETVEASFLYRLQQFFKKE